MRSVGGGGSRAPGTMALEGGCSGLGETTTLLLPLTEAAAKERFPVAGVAESANAEAGAAAWTVRRLTGSATAAGCFVSSAESGKCSYGMSANAFPSSSDELLLLAASLLGSVHTGTLCEMLCSVPTLVDRSSRHRGARPTCRSGAPTAAFALLRAAATAAAASSRENAEGPGSTPPG